MKTNPIVTGSFLFAALISTTSYTQEYTSGITFYPQLGYYAFDSKRDLGNEMFIGIGAGYLFDNPWGIEFNYLEAEPEIDNSNFDIDFDQYRLDGLYRFSADRPLQPYLAAGIGNAYFKNRFVDDTETQYNVGGGIKYFFTDTFALRGDARVFYDANDDTWDYALTLGLFIQIGEKLNRTPATPRPPQPVPPPEDGDGDGVADSFDQCPNTPANMKVNTSGCIPDSDSDGVADNLDKCPNSATGAKVDESGCYILLTETRTIELNIQFPNNSDEISARFHSEIGKIADFMKEYPQTTVVVEGHTDDRGTAQYNQQLSQRRAQAVAKALVNDFNIASDRVTAVGKGEAEPIASNSTAEGRKANRRVVGVVSASVQTRSD